MTLPDELCCDALVIPRGHGFREDQVKVCDQPLGHGGSHSGDGWRWAG